MVVLGLVGCAGGPSSITSLQAARQKYVCLQGDEDALCGPAALATIARFILGDDVSVCDVEVALREMLGEEEYVRKRRAGFSFADLQAAALTLGYVPYTKEMPLADLAYLVRVLGIAPIVHLDPNMKRRQDEDPELVLPHFAVVIEIADGFVRMADPRIGQVRRTLPGFLNAWSGRVLYLTHADGSVPQQHVLTSGRSVGSEMLGPQRALYVLSVRR